MNRHKRLLLMMEASSLVEPNKHSVENQNQNTSVIFPSDGTTPASSSLGSQDSINSLSSAPVSLQPTNTSLPPKKPENFLIRLVKRADVVLALLLVLGSLGLVLNAVLSGGKGQQGENSAASQFDTTQIPLEELITDAGIDFGSQSVTINGALLVNDAFVLSPSQQPTSAVAGQMYYDQTSNVLAYYNGTQFVPVTGSSAAVVQSAGAGLTLTGTQISNSGVLSIQGQTGDVTLTAGNGIGVSGTTISNTGVVNLISTDSTLVVTNDGSGNYELTVNLGGAGVTSLNGLSGVLTLANASAAGSTVTIDDASTAAKGIAQFNPANFSAAGGIVNTIQNIGAGATPTFAGVNTNNITPSGALTVGSTGQQLTLQGNASTQLTATSGGFATTLGFTGVPVGNVTYNLDRSVAAGTYTLCSTIGNCAGSGGGVTSGGGAVNRLAKFTASQNIEDSSITDDGTNVTTTADLVIQGGDVTVGVPSAQTGTINLAHSGSAFLGSFVQGALTANRSYLLPDANGTVCLSSGNCSGGGSTNTLQAAYDAGNTITTSDNRSLVFTLAETATDSNFLVNLECDTACGGNGRFAIQDDGTDIVTVVPVSMTLGTNVDLLLQGASAFISNPQGQSASESFGLNATVSGANALAVGNGATAALDAVAVGQGATAVASGVAVGQGAVTTGAFGGPVAIGDGAVAASWGVALGSSSSTSGNWGTAIGQGATTVGQLGTALGNSASAGQQSIAIGANAAATGNNQIAIGYNASTTANNQLVIGGPSADGSNVTNAYLGSGVTDATPQGIVLQATGGSGTDIAGASLTLAGGQGTGSANGGNIAFQVSAPGGSGTALNALTTVATLQGGTGAANFINVVDSTSAFNVEENGGGNLLTVDTVNSRVGVNLGANNTPTLAAGTQGLEVQGALRISGTGSTGWDNFTTPVGSLVPAKVNIVAQSMNPFGQIMALGLTSGSSDSARGLSIFDARTVAHQPTLAVFSPDENSMIGFSWNGSNTAAAVQTNSQATGSTDAIILQSGNVTAGNGSSGEVIVASGSIQGGTGGSTGNLTLQSGNGAGTNSSSGNIVLDNGVKTGSGTAGTISIGGTNTSALTIGRTGLTTNNAGTFTLGQLGATDTAAYLCRNGSNILAACSTSGVGAAFVQGGNSFTGVATLGTNDAFDLRLERGGTTQLTVGNGTVTLASNVDLLLQGATAYISNPQGTANSEVFGNGASTTADRNVIIGNSATSGAESDSVVIGFDATGTGNAVVIGAEANCTNNGCTAIGWQAVAAFGGTSLGSGTSANHNLAIAIGAGAATGDHNSIALGADAVTTTTNQMVVGSSSSAISQVVIGNGVTNAVPTGFTLQGTGGSGTNIAGASISIASGAGTGNANGGNINFQIADPGTSGSSLNSLATVQSLSGVNGAATFQNTTDSANAFRILNAAGTGEHFGVDTADSILRLLANNTGHLSGTATNWNTATTLPAARAAGASATVNGYVYHIGGCDPGGGSTASVYYARANSNGSLSAWGTTTSIPVAMCGGTATSYNGYIYVNGSTGASATSRDIYYAKPNTDGTITSWTTQNDPINYTIGLKDQGMAAYNGYLYITGGYTDDGLDNRNRTVFYARINADGSVPSFTAQTNWLPDNDFNAGQTLVANGYLYVFGTANYNTFYYGLIKADGSVGNFDGSGSIATNITGSTDARKYSAIAVMNGYMYVIAGGFDPPQQNTVQYGAISNNGDIPSFSAADSTTLPAGRWLSTKTAPVVNNYIYFVGGADNSDIAQNTVYYASGARVKVGGGLDLVGYSGESMSEGGTGGQLTAGNTFVNGSLSVTGNATFKDGAAVGGPLNVLGTQTIQTSTNTDSAFKILNSAGQQLLNVGTVHNPNDVVTNGSIETNTTGWAAKGSATISRTTAQQYVGLASLSTTTTAAIGDGARYNITLSSSTQYTASFYAKLDSGSFTNMSFGYSSDGVAETDCKTSQQVKTGGWHSFNCTFTTGIVSGTPYFYWEQAGATARTVYVDALQIVPGQDIGAYYDGKINTGGLVFSGPVAIQNDNDSNSALQVQGSTGTTAFGVDTLNYRVGVNLISAQATLHVLTIGTTSVTALFNQASASTEDILQLQKGGNTTASVTHDGITTFQNLTDSTASFRILGSNVTFGSGTPLFVADTTNSRIYIGNPTTDTTGALLVLDTKTSSGDPSTTGLTNQAAMYYNSNAAKMRCYENGAWKNCLGMPETITLFGLNGNGAASVWGNMPAAETEFMVGAGVTNPSNRIRVDLTDVEQIRFQVNVHTIGSANAEIRIQYSTDQSSWNYLDNGGTGLGQNINTLGLKVSSWSAIASGAKGDVYLRMTGINGSGAVSPAFGLIQLQVR